MYRNRNNYKTRRNNFDNRNRNGFRKPVFKNENNGYPEYVNNLYQLFKINADLRRIASFVIHKLLVDNGYLKPEEKWHVEFMPNKYKVSHYTPGTDGKFNPNLGEEFAYNTKEFYIALNASCAILANIGVYHLGKYYEYIPNNFDLEDTKNLNKIYQSCIDSISKAEINRLEAKSAKADETEEADESEEVEQVDEVKNQ